MEEAHVKLHVPLSDEVITLSTLDQQAQRNYIEVALVFSLDADANIPGHELACRLKAALAVALTEIPDFASTIAPVPGTTRKELELRVGPDSGVTVRVVDHAALINSPLRRETYASLSAAHFQFLDLPHDTLFVPRPNPEEPASMPATLIQLNLVPGGLILGFAWHHTVGDAQSACVFIKNWARHAKILLEKGVLGAPTPPNEETRVRWRLSHSAYSAHGSQFPEYIINAAIRAPETEVSKKTHLLDCANLIEPTAIASTWYFSSMALQALRGHLALAGVQCTPSEATSALIWKHLALARRLHERMPERSSLFSTRLDFRGRMRPALDEEFIGNINEPNAVVRASIKELCTLSTPQSLAALVSLIQSAVARLDGLAVETFIGVVDGLSSVTDLVWGYDPFPGPDLVISDTSGLETVQQDWGGPVGYPTRFQLVSRHSGLTYITPKDRDGGFEVQIQCEREGLDRLRADPIFTQYAELRF